MKTYIVNYVLERNCFRGTMAIRADDIESAQDKFLEWLKQQDSYKHLWRLQFQFEEIEGAL
jgi:hypothetical protein